MSTHDQQHRHLQDESAAVATLVGSSVEVVAYSPIDHEVYLRWPSKDSAAHMAAIPDRLLEDPQGLHDWCQGQGLTVAAQDTPQVAAYLRSETARFRRH